MRLDLYLVASGDAESRTKAQYLISEGCVTVDGKVVTKASFDVDGRTVEVVGEGLGYVGRGALKLKGALESFGICVEGYNCVDIGASTGGFTDCLLKGGASHVLCVDSGTDQLHPSLRSDVRVTVLEQFNAKHLDSDAPGAPFDLACMDVSFISQTALYPNVKSILKNDGCFISLVKPQFECGKKWIGKGGIVKKREAHVSVLEKIDAEARSAGLFLKGMIRSPITGGDGNTEYLALFSPTEDGNFRLSAEKIVPEVLNK